MKQNNDEISKTAPAQDPNVQIKPFASFQSNEYASEGSADSMKGIPEETTGGIRYQNRNTLSENSDKNPRAPFVEDRLHQYKEKYMEKRKEASHAFEQEEIKEKPLKPKIDEVSERIVAQMNRIPCVEERLIMSGQLAKAALEERRKKLQGESKVSTKKRTKEDNEVVDRLYKYMKEQEEKLQELKKKKDAEEQYPFAPQIDKSLISEILAQKESKRSQSNRAKKQQEDPDSCTFQPKISKNSLNIAKKLGPPGNRLLLQKEAPTPPTMPVFAPEINPISSELDKRSKLQKEGGKPVERWELLYGLNEKKKAGLEELKKQYEEADPKNNECTFKPQLMTKDSLTMSRDGTEKNKKKSVEGVQTRTMLWQRRKEERIKALKETVDDKELEGCTFQPHLVATSTAHVAMLEKEEEPNKSTISSADAFIASMKSVEKYIEKQKALREQKEQSQKRAEQYAGSGNLWTKKITVPKAPHFMSKVEKEELKALSKPIAAGQDAILKDNKVRHHKSYPKSEAQIQYLKANKQIESFGKADNELNPIVENIEFTEALGMLHKDLMGIQIENPNFQ